MIERTEELLPCAHCGGAANFSECVDYIKAYCSCGIQTDAVYHWDSESRKQKVIDMWNRRA